MDLIFALGLIVVLFVAMNHMAGGRPHNVLRPASRILGSLVNLAVKIVLNIFGGVFRIGASSVRMPKLGGLNKDTDRGPGPPPTRWT